MITEQENEVIAYRKKLAEDVHHLLLEEMRKAVAEKNWSKVNSIVYLLRGSN